jgi:hypothetical protein
MSGRRLQKLRRRLKVLRKQARREVVADVLHDRMVEQAMGLSAAKLEETTRA